MAKKPAGAKKKKPVDAPKQRTREHVIASISTNFVEKTIYEKGYAAQRVENDYGFDLLMQTFTANGYVEPGFVLLQLKATDHIKLVAKNAFVSFTISVSDYKSWMKQAYPVFLIVFDAMSSVAYWLYIQKYFTDDTSQRPGAKATTVTVRIPAGNVVSAATIDYMKDRKDKVMAKYDKVQHGYRVVLGEGTGSLLALQLLDERAHCIGRTKRATRPGSDHKHDPGAGHVGEISADRAESARR